MIKREKLRFKELINEILDKMPEELFISSSTTFLDPCFASGQFLNEIGLRLSKYGHTKENIKSRLFGIEKSRLNLFLISKYHEVEGNFYYGNVLKDNIFKDIDNKNILELENMKFDCVIGNPPYASHKNSNFYVDFVIKANELVTNDGYVTLITPNRYSIPKSDLNNALNKLNILEIKNDVSKSFNVATFIGYYIGQQSTIKPDNSKTIYDFGDFKKEIDLVNGILPTQKVKIEQDTLSILKKIFDYPHKLQTSKTSSKNSVWMQRQFKYYTTNKIEKFPILKFNIIDCKNNDGKYFVLKANDSKENFKHFLSESKLMLFLSYCFSGSMNVIPILWTKIPNLDFSKKWSDEELYTLFNLIDSEIEYIKRTIVDLHD